MLCLLLARAGGPHGCSATVASRRSTSGRTGGAVLPIFVPQRPKMPFNAPLTTASRHWISGTVPAIRLDQQNDEAMMAQAPILAAGGIVLRGGARPRIAVVQRRKDNGWVLPKGKLKSNESAISAARREACEETGHDVAVREFLGVIYYLASGRPKLVHFWRMQAAGPAERMLTRDIKALEWLPLASAIERLSRPHEQAFLRQVGQRAVKLTKPESWKGANSARRSVRRLATHLANDSRIASCE
jgi:8-oxo-dGTP diphosphatase